MQWVEDIYYISYIRLEVSHRVVNWGALLDGVQYKTAPPTLVVNDSQDIYLHMWH